MPDRPWTDAEQRAAGDALDAWLTGLGLPVGLVQSTRPYGAAAAVLDAVTPLIAGRAARAERVRIVRALRNLPCPDGERPGARITADEHQRWLTDVIGAVNTTTEGTDHA